MDRILDYIKANKLIKQGEIIGVATSGGRDSMALLHFLHDNREALNCQVIAINIDHCIREHSAADSALVMDYCKENNIKTFEQFISVTPSEFVCTNIHWDCKCMYFF